MGVLLKVVTFLFVQMQQFPATFGDQLPFHLEINNSQQSANRTNSTSQSAGGTGRMPDGNGSVTIHVDVACEDTIGWTNGYPCSRQGKTLANGCAKTGWTCSGYEKQGWCVHGHQVPYSKSHVWAFGPKLNYPEENCCVCGTNASNYIAYWDKNAYHPYGAIDMDNDSSAPVNLSRQECEDRCSDDRKCQCVTHFRQSGQCWKRMACEPVKWTSGHNIGYNVYVKKPSALVPSP